MFGDWYDVRGEAEAWIARQEARSPQFKIDVTTLVAAGCERSRLGWLLQGLDIATSETECLSRADVRKMSNVLKNAKNIVLRLSRSGIAHVLNGSDVVVGHTDALLGELVRRMREIDPFVDFRFSLDRDLWRAAIVCYVQHTSKRVHNDAVAGLIKEAESADDYTTDDHIHWRKRSSAAKKFLNEQSDHVGELLSRMEAALAQ